MFQITTKLSRIFQDHLYRNSMFSGFSRILTASSGFLFWVIASKLYSIDTVGMTTALISSLNLIMLFSRFGFDISIIRYIANNDKNKTFNTSLVITTAGSVVIGLIYILSIRIFQADYALNLADEIFFLLIAPINSIALISANMFLALRKSQYLFIQTIFISFRLFLLFPFMYFGNIGIFLSLGICYILSVIYSLWALRKEVKINFLQIDKPFVKESYKFSVQSYLSNILTEAPILILPIVVLNLLGQQETAKYYMAMAIGSLVFIVPNSLCLSLFVEGSHGQPLKQNIMKVCKWSFLSLIFFIIVINVWGKNILSLINNEYIDAYNLLIFLIIASIFEVIYMVYIYVQNINMRVDRNIKLNLLRFIFLIGSSFYLLPVYNIDGIGYAWLLTHVILTLIIGGLFIKTVIIKKIERSI
ncbi:MAG: lipopolysaccharide biosynthesis protein [Eubacteriales bacterium]